MNLKNEDMLSWIANLFYIIKILNVILGIFVTLVI